MNINGRLIGPDRPPYVIAEISNNHLADPERAYRLIEVAAKAGADAVKIQTYDADSLTIDCDRPEFIIQTPPWEGLNYYELYKKIALPTSFTEKLFGVARDCGITIFSSPFDEGAVTLLQSLDCPAYKVASFEACDDSLLKAVAATGVPVLVSTGVASIDDLKESLQVLRSAGCSDVALLHCISAYPATNADMNLRAIERLAELSTLVGLSDHSLSNFAPTLAVACGAVLIEKHFTLARADGGPDASFSLEPDELADLVRSVYEAWEAMGDADVLIRENRLGSEHARSVFVVQDVIAGERLRVDDLRVIRPGLGLHPRCLPKVIGRVALRDLARGQPLSWEDIQ